MNRRIKLAVWILVAAILLGEFLWVWIQCQEDREEPNADLLFAVEEQGIEPINIEVRTVHGNEALFGVTAEDFIRSFNSLFERDYCRSYFPPLEDWSGCSYNSGIHSQYPAMKFVFSEDEKIYSLPTVTIYTPMEQRAIQEITVNFDEHSYTEAGYQRYKQLCSYTLKVFFPKLSEDAVSQICDQVIAAGNQNVFDSDAWFGSGAVPFALFCRDGVGIYPYFAIGDWQRFCVIPVTEEIIADFKQKGVEIYEIQ